MRGVLFTPSFHSCSDYLLVPLICEIYSHVAAWGADAGEQLYVWNVDTHPSKPRNDDKTYPNLILEGHKDIADFALAMNGNNASCASGGKVSVSRPPHR